MLQTVSTMSSFLSLQNFHLSSAELLYLKWLSRSLKFSSFSNSGWKSFTCHIFRYWEAAEVQESFQKRPFDPFFYFFLAACILEIGLQVCFSQQKYCLLSGRQEWKGQSFHCISCHEKAHTCCIFASYAIVHDTVAALYKSHDLPAFLFPLWAAKQARS